MVWLQVELSDGTAHTITDAYPGKEYIIQVAAKDNDIGTWSDWSVAAHATPWTEEPRHLTTEAQAPGEPVPAPLCLRSACTVAWLCPAPCSSSWDSDPLPQGSPHSVLPFVCLAPAVPGPCCLDMLGRGHWVEGSSLSLGETGFA